MNVRSVAVSYNQCNDGIRPPCQFYCLEPRDQDGNSCKVSARLRVEASTKLPTVNTRDKGQQCIRRLPADMEYLAKFIQLVIMSKVHASEWCPGLLDAR